MGDHPVYAHFGQCIFDIRAQSCVIIRVNRSGHPSQKRCDLTVAHRGEINVVFCLKVRLADIDICLDCDFIGGECACDQRIARRIFWINLRRGRCGRDGERIFGKNMNCASISRENGSVKLLANNIDSRDARDILADNQTTGTILGGRPGRDFEIISRSLKRCPNNRYMRGF